MPTEHRQESKRSARAGFLDQSQKKSTSTKCPPNAEAFHLPPPRLPRSISKEINLDQKSKCPPNAEAFHLPHQFCVNSRKSTRLRLEHDLLRSSETQATYFFRGATYFFGFENHKIDQARPATFFLSVARYSFGYEVTTPTSPFHLPFQTATVTWPPSEETRLGHVILRKAKVKEDMSTPPPQFRSPRIEKM
jgi:hypothetical protein